MTTSADLLDLVQAALVDATTAGARVYRPGDWPLWDGTLPAIRLRVTLEDKQALGRAGVKFTVTTTVRIVASVAAVALEDDAGAAAAETAVATLQRQIEAAVINSQPLTAQIQRFAFVRSATGFTADGEKHQAAVNIDLGLEFYQDETDFAPIDSDPLETVDIAVPDPAAGLTISLPQPDD